MNVTRCGVGDRERCRVALMEAKLVNCLSSSFTTVSSQFLELNVSCRLTSASRASCCETSVRLPFVDVIDGCKVVLNEMLADV